jgi:hypothetical protein
MLDCCRARGRETVDPVYVEVAVGKETVEPVYVDDAVRVIGEAMLI